MNQVPYYFFAAAIFCGSATSYATCGHNGIPDEVCPAPASPVADAVTANPANVANAAAAANAQQQQGQRQGISGSGNSRSSATAAGSSGNITNISTGAQPGSGSSYRSLAVALPSAPPAIAPTMVGGAISTTALSCGPAQRILAEPVYGRERGLFGSTDVFLGNTEKTVDYLDENGTLAPYIQIQGRWYGHQIIYATGMPGVSAGTSIGFGGFGSAGGGNAGGGTSGGMQRMITTIQLRLCEYAPVHHAHVPGFARVGYAPAPVVVAPVRRAPRKPVKPKAPAVAASVAAESCVETATMACRRPPMGIKLN